MNHPACYTKNTTKKAETVSEIFIALIIYYCAVSLFLPVEIKKKKKICVKCKRQLTCRDQIPSTSLYVNKAIISSLDNYVEKKNTDVAHFSWTLATLDREESDLSVFMALVGTSSSSDMKHRAVGAVVPSMIGVRDQYGIIMIVGAP